MCFLGRGTYIAGDMCSLIWEIHNTSDMCSPTPETRIPSDMCSPYTGNTYQ